MVLIIYIILDNNPKKILSGDLSIESEHFYTLRRSTRQSSSQMTSHLDSTFYKLGSYQPCKCIIVGPYSNLGYSHGVKILQNMKVMQATKKKGRPKPKMPTLI